MSKTLLNGEANEGGGLEASNSIKACGDVEMGQTLSMNN